MGKKLGSLIRSARTDAGLTQEQLANKVKGVARTDISKFERGLAEPTAQNVKDIAKACGVAQKPLLDAMPKTSAKPASSSSSSKPSSSTKPSTSSKSSMQVTATERKLVELYRAADTETKKKALALLRGDDDGIGIDDIISGLGGLLGDVLGVK